MVLIASAQDKHQNREVNGWPVSSFDDLDPLNAPEAIIPGCNCVYKRLKIQGPDYKFKVDSGAGSWKPGAPCAGEMPRNGTKACPGASERSAVCEALPRNG
ncbi:hypothetical protein EDD11_009968 [Mortierella claussenii]|nr:hypothetical protein EDD11_009968 [Mortierella claussenii]